MQSSITTARMNGFHRLNYVRAANKCICSVCGLQRRSRGSLCITICALLLSFRFYSTENKARLSLTSEVANWHRRLLTRTPCYFLTSEYIWKDSGVSGGKYILKTMIYWQPQWENYMAILNNGAANERICAVTKLKTHWRYHPPCNFRDTFWVMKETKCKKIQNVF